MKRWRLWVLGSFLVLVWTTGARAQFGMSGGQNQGGGVPGQGAAQSADSGSGADVDAIAELLGDKDPTIRLQAVQALAAEAKDEVAIRHLIDATADADTRVRLKAIDSLGNARASVATPILVQSLYLRDSQPWLTQRVLVALGKIGDPRAAKPIADFLERDAKPNLIGTAIFSLGEIGHEGSIEALSELEEGTQNDRLALLARDAIGKIRKRQINPEIQIQALRPAPGAMERPASASAGAPLAGY